MIPNTSAVILRTEFSQNIIAARSRLSEALRSSALLFISFPSTQNQKRRPCMGQFGPGDVRRRRLCPDHPSISFLDPSANPVLLSGADVTTETDPELCSQRFDPRSCYCFGHRFIESGTDNAPWTIPEKPPGSNQESRLCSCPRSDLLRTPGGDHAGCQFRIHDNLNLDERRDALDRSDSVETSPCPPTCRAHRHTDGYYLAASVSADERIASKVLYPPERFFARSPCCERILHA
jgi:hypothetical protein